MSRRMTAQVYAIYGPTASGKTALAIELARSTGAVILNADSMQIYSDLRIITARPSAEEEAAAEHRLYGVLKGDDPCSVARWVSLIKSEIEHLRPRPVILVGGTGLYLNALHDGLSNIPEPDDMVRRQAAERLARLGLSAFREEVLALDPQTLDTIIDPQRLQRIWAVTKATGKPLSQWQGDKQGGIGPFPIFDLAPDRADLHDRINRRFDVMLELGALAEVEEFLSLNYAQTLPISRAVGLPELVSVLQNETDLETAREKACASSRQYAKRQLTWGRNQLAHAIKFREYPIILEEVQKIKADILSVIG